MEELYSNTASPQIGILTEDKKLPHPQKILNNQRKSDG